MSDVLKDLDGIPAASKELWEKLVDEEKRPVHALVKEVKTYQQAIAQRSSVRNADVDPTLGNALADASMKLLTTLKDDTPEERRKAIQAAVRYFVIEDDADSDLDSILGPGRRCRGVERGDEAPRTHRVARRSALADWNVRLPRAIQ